MHYAAFSMAHKITGTFSLAFEKGRIGKVQNYIGTKRKIFFLKIIAASAPSKWTPCPLSSNFYQLLQLLGEL